MDDVLREDAEGRGRRSEDSARFLGTVPGRLPAAFLCRVRPCAAALRIRARKRDMDFLRGRKDGPAWGFDPYFSEDYPDMRFQEDFKVAKSTAAALRDTLLFVGLENARGLIEVLDMYATARGTHAPTLAHSRIKHTRSFARRRAHPHDCAYSHARAHARYSTLTLAHAGTVTRRSTSQRRTRAS